MTENSVLWLGFLFPSFLVGFITTNQRPDLTILKNPVLSELTDNASWLTQDLYCYFGNQCIHEEERDADHANLLNIWN